METALNKAIFWFELDSAPGPHFFQQNVRRNYVWYWLLEAALAGEI